MNIKAILLGAVSTVTLVTSMQASASWFGTESYFVECHDAKNNRPIFFEWAYSRTQLSQVKSRCRAMGGRAYAERVR